MFRANVTLNDLVNFAEEKENLVGGKKFTKNMIKKIVKEDDYDMNIVYDSGNVMIVDVQTPDGIKKIGCNSLWCFTYGKEFQNAYRDWNNYSTNDHVYVIIDFSLSSDSPEFMHVLIKPLNYNAQPSDDGDENDSKLFNMANEESYNAVGIVKHLVGDQAPFIMHFDEPINSEGPASKWPYEDPNQTKLNLKEIRRMVREAFVDTNGELVDFDIRINYPYEEIWNLIKGYFEKNKKHWIQFGWSIFDAHNSDELMNKYKSDSNSFFRVEKITELDNWETPVLDFLKSDKEAHNRAKQAGFILDEDGVVLGLNGVNLVDK